jgi:drug/metabolite transporter (DMT)-like permease
MDNPQHARWIGLTCLGVTAVGWALNWPLMKILLRSWPPLFARGLAGTCAAFILAALALGCGQSLRVPRKVIPKLLLSSFTNVFAWMGLGTVAMKFISVAEGALIIYTMPIWAMLLAWPLRHLRPSGRDIAGLVLGMMGVALLLGANGFAIDTGELIGIVLSFSCAILFALGNVLTKAPLPLPPIAAVAWQVGIGCFVMLLLGILVERPNYTAITPTGLACFTYMTLVPMGLCYVTWFETLKRLPTTAASTGMLLVPAIAIAAANITLGEAFGVREVAAIALTLGGVALALQRPQGSANLSTAER